MRSICLFLIIGFTNIVYAKYSYHVNELVSMVIKNHPSIKMQEHMIKGADAQVESAKWNYFPTVSFSANQGVNQEKLWDGTAVVSQPLWTGGKLDANYDMAIANRDNSKSGLGESGYTLVDTLFTALKTYVKNKGNIKALSEGKKQLNILKNMLSRRIKAGVSSRSDMELLKARLYQMQTDINYAKASMQASLSQIELLTNHDFKGALEVDDRISFDFDSLDTLIKSMIKTHPTLKKYDALIDYAKAEKSNAKAVLMPNVSLKVERGVRSNDYYYNDSTGETRVYLSVDASFGAGLSAVSGIEQAEAKIMQLKQEKLATQQDLINKMMLSYNDYISSSSRVRSQSGSISSSKKVFESYTRLFLAGKRQWLDLVNTSRELTQNKMAFADTKSTLLVSAYQLLLLSGKSDLQKMIPDTKTEEITPSKDIDKVFIPSMDIVADGTKQKDRLNTNSKTKERTKSANRIDSASKKTLKSIELKDLKAAIKREAEKQRLAKQKAEKEKAKKLKLAKEKAAREKAEKERVAKQKAAQEKAEKIRLAQEKAAKEKLAKQKAEKEKHASEKLAKQKAEKQHSVSAHPKYYVQFDTQLNKEMKYQLRKRHLKVKPIEEGHYLVGAYDRAVEALTAVREIKNIIHDEAYIVRQ
ncbi:MAG: TolC family protein [Sulfurimonas sp.]